MKRLCQTDLHQLSAALGRITSKAAKANHHLGTLCVAVGLPEFPQAGFIEVLRQALLETMVAAQEALESLPDAAQK